MHDIRRINVQENILDENDHIAEHVNEHMTHHGVLVVNEMGAPGVGKTTSLKNIGKHRKSRMPCRIQHRRTRDDADFHRYGGQRQALQIPARL